MMIPSAFINAKIFLINESELIPMHFGLYLKGGGAKGAFQAGLLCAFWQRGVTYSVIGGTSIGAIHGWYVLHDAYKELEELYTTNDGALADFSISGKVLDNSTLIQRLKEIDKPRNPEIRNFYVNYVAVNGSTLQEKTEEIAKLDEANALDRIRWSALLPLNQPKKMTFEEYVRYAGRHDLEEKFAQDLEDQVYDGIHLDGGIVNNRIIPGIFDHSNERIIALGYNGTREEYLNTLTDLEQSHREKIVYISSDEAFKATDTYNFKPEFLKKRFKEGYEKGIDFPLIRLVSS